MSGLQDAAAAGGPPPCNPYVEARSKVPSGSTQFVLDNAPYLPTVAVSRDLGSEELKAALLALANAMNGVPAVGGAAITNNLGVQGGWLYPPDALVDASDAAQWSLRTIVGGITNSLYLLSHGSLRLGRASEGVLVRLFGGEGIIDRDKETVTYAALCQANIGDAYLGRFKNGRIEGFLAGYKNLEPLDFAEANTSAEIARQLATMHQFAPSTEYLRAVYPRTSGLWDDLESWMGLTRGALAKKEYRTARDQERVEGLDWEWINGSIAKCRQWCDRMQPQLAFCHNDLLAGNVMRCETSGRVQLIDFEYGCMNYVGFDLANHFNEFAGGTDDSEPKYEQLPGAEERKKFVEGYVWRMRELAGKVEGEGGGQMEVEGLLGEVDVFIFINHFYWGMWGSCLGASEGTDKFDYINYCVRRLQQAKKVEAAAEAAMQKQP
jgi:ethanolamine kinase